MEGTSEGLAAAAATREVLSKKRKAQADVEGAPASKKIAKRPPPTCAHEVARPKDFDDASVKLDEAIYGTLDAPVYKGEMAKTYPFQLDPFQQTSIACLERRESVLVAAHTSAGKTVVAEYAIAMAFRDKQRVIYTSPIKALSNQKYRELAAEFGDVGLMTGDVTLNPNASVIVMTTEILRAMIYKGSELLREVAWVVFDEVHYMQDRERGVVWEETIVFLDHGTRMVFLSATLSNASDFAAWVAHLHSQPCHVVFTDYRPTPLRHYAYPMGTGVKPGLYLLKDDKGAFRTENVARMVASFEEAEAADEAGPGAGKKGGGGGRGEKGGRGGGDGGDGRGDKGGGGAAGDGGKAEDKGDGKVRPCNTRQEQRAAVKGAVTQLAIQMHSGKLPNWLPAIFFSFSKRECEEYARQCYKNDKGCAGLCFTTQEEQEAIDQVFDNAIQCLNEADRDLRAVTELRFMLKAGVGVHHGGLLPLMKEVVELLFSEGFIKLLFTTETFAMGLNMPAKTVLFTSLTKWDGSESRYITSGEYIQMSGRAGRRNQDSHGNVVVLADKTLNEEVAKGLMMGAPSPLVSSFKLSYYTLLNLMKRPEVGTKDLELVIANSFQQFQRDRAAPKLREELTKLEGQIATIDAGAQAAISEYRELRARLAAAREVVRAAVLRPDRVMAFLRPGRLVRVAEGKTDWGWGVVVNVIRRPPQGKAARPPGDPAAAASAAQDPPSYYIVDILLACEPGSVDAKAPRPAAPGGAAVAEVLPVSLALVQELSTLRVALPADLRPPEARQGVLASLRDVARRYPDGLPLLDPVEDVGVTDDPGLRAAVADAADAQARLAHNEVFISEKDKTRYEAFAAQAALLQRAAKIRAELKGSALEKFRDEVTHRTAVMKKLGFLNQEGILTQKGLAAALIDTTDELLTAELMFNGVFKNLDAPQLAALVSCLVFCEKTNDEVNLVKQLADALAHLQSAARAIAAVSHECKVEVDEEAYVESFRPTLMDVTYRWAQGAAFAEICSLTELYEGSIIRAIRRLDELLTQLAASAAEVGEAGPGALQGKFLEAQAAIRRDIVFAASLYL